MTKNNFAYELTKFETLPPVKLKQFDALYKCPNCGSRLSEPKPKQVIRCLFCGMLVRG